MHLIHLSRPVQSWLRRHMDSDYNQDSLLSTNYQSSPLLTKVQPGNILLLYEKGRSSDTSSQALYAFLNSGILSEFHSPESTSFMLDQVIKIDTHTAWIAFWFSPNSTIHLVILNLSLSLSVRACN